MHELARFLGLTDPSGAWYAFWSGIGSDITEFAIVAIVWRKINCHAKGCWRIGLHKVDGTRFITCRKHHPLHDGPAPATAQQIAQAHDDVSARPLQAP